MKGTLTFALVALAVVSGNARAQATGRAPLGREDVVRQVLDARANGALRRAGEPGPRGDGAYAADVAAPPTITRLEQTARVLQARRARELAHAGAVAPEEEMAEARTRPSTATRSREEVKQQVLEALADARPNPGGAGAYPDVPYRRSIFAKPADPGGHAPTARGK